jgi:hypothetical protein
VTEVTLNLEEEQRTEQPPATQNRKFSRFGFGGVPVTELARVRDYPAESARSLGDFSYEIRNN